MLHASLGVAYCGLMMVHKSLESFREAVDAAQKEIDSAQEGSYCCFQTYQERVEWLSQCTDARDTADQVTASSESSAEIEQARFDKIRAEARKTMLQDAGCKQQ